MACKDHNLNIMITSTNELLIINKSYGFITQTVKNISFFCRPSFTAAVRAVVTGVNPALMGTSGSSGSTHPCPKVSPTAAGPSWQPGCPAGGRPDSQLTPQNPELFTWACCSSLQSIHTRFRNPTYFYFPFPLLSSATACLGPWPTTFPKEFTTHSFN